MISIEALESMFDNIRQDAPWNIDGPMLWGYFFKHGADTKLRELVPALEAQGYRLVDICTHTGEADQEGAAYFLHVEKTEIHSVQSLHARNEQLAAFAAHHQIDSYDGMDVGPATSTTTTATMAVTENK